MTLERILVGDDRIEFAKQAMPYVPGAEVTFVDNPQQCIAEARTGRYGLVITDLQYTPEGTEGFDVLEALQDLSVRKILWTGASHTPGVRERAEELGAELLAKNELGTLVGMAVSETPMKQGGIVLVYTPEKAPTPIYRALEQVLHTFFGPEKVVLSSDLKGELEKGEYGLVIDTSTLSSTGREMRFNGTVAHDLKYIPLDEVPRVCCISSAHQAVPEMITAIGEHYKGD